MVAALNPFSSYMELEHIVQDCFNTGILSAAEMVSHDRFHGHFIFLITLQ
jgi:hypothetical protein